MLEEYYGYYERHGHNLKDEYGNDVMETVDGESKHVWVVDREEWHDGRITELANQAKFLEERRKLGIRFLEDRTFANFKKDRDADAFNACSIYASAENLFSQKKNSLILFGGVGCGKTHLAGAITNVFADKGLSISFDTFIEHLNAIKNEFNSPNEGRHIHDMKNAMLLVLDDLGQEKPSEWTKQMLYEIVNFRYEHKLPMIITTNLNQDELANYVGHPIYSRLNEMCNSVHMKGSDYRMERR